MFSCRLKACSCQESFHRSSAHTSLSGQELCHPEIHSFDVSSPNLLSPSWHALGCCYRRASGASRSRCVLPTRPRRPPRCSTGSITPRSSSFSHVTTKPMWVQPRSPCSNKHVGTHTSIFEGSDICLNEDVYVYLHVLLGHKHFYLHSAWGVCLFIYLLYD